VAATPPDGSPAEIRYRPIGHVETPHRSPAGAPIQPSGARGVRGTIRLRAGLEPALDGLEGFSHLILVYHCHRAGAARLAVTPYLDDRPRGVLATRAPARPNPIGLSVVRLVAVRADSLEVEDVDLLDGTPLLDIKPFVPAFDMPEGEVRFGWLEECLRQAVSARADERFHGGG
jgi:tRNA (adenine37-N6)-methyltransferase